MRKSGERCEEGCESSVLTLRNTPGAEWMREIKGPNVSRVSSVPYGYPSKGHVRVFQELSERWKEKMSEDQRGRSHLKRESEREHVRLLNFAAINEILSPAKRPSRSC